VKVSAFLGLSLDGFLARPDGSIDWLEPFHDPEDDAGYGAFFAEVSVVPVVLGAGRRLWDGLPEQTWRLLDARRCARGLTQARYAMRPAGAGGG
jgi:dihydrofolate reductase